MPEKKPDPIPPPRNRHERRKRATKDRKARKWTRAEPVRIKKPPANLVLHAAEEFVTFETIGSGKVHGSDGTTWEVVGEVPLDETKVVRPDDLQITTISLVTITPEVVAKVAEKTGRSVDAVNAYLAGTEQDATLLDAFLFFGVAPTGKLPPSRLRPYQARAVHEALNSGGIASFVPKDQT